MIPARPDLPPALVRHGWQWHPALATARVRETPQRREIRDAGSVEASIAAALRSVPRRGRPPKQRSA